MICGIKTCIISYKKRIVSPGLMQDTGSLGLVHWDDPEGWYGEGGGSGVQDGEHVYTRGYKALACHLLDQLAPSKGLFLASAPYLSDSLAYCAVSRSSLDSVSIWLSQPGSCCLWLADPNQGILGQDPSSCWDHLS